MNFDANTQINIDSIIEPMSFKVNSLIGVEIKSPITHLLRK